MDDDSQKMLEVFEEGCEFIESAKRENSDSRILVHCHLGISRSPSVVLYYLVRNTGMSLEAAMKFLKKKRAIVSPRHSFMHQLIDAEEALTGKASTLSKETYPIQSEEPKSTKSFVILDIKPISSQVPMDELEIAIRGIDMDGLKWGKCSLLLFFCCCCCCWLPCFPLTSLCLSSQLIYSSKTKTDNIIYSKDRGNWIWNQEIADILHSRGGGR